MNPSKRLRLGYLVSQYPAINHTFILREIRGLRQLGFEITVISIRGPDRDPAALAPDEREELRDTHAVLAGGIAPIFGAHLRTLLVHPAGYLRGLFHALRLAGPDLRRCLSHLFYFAEAVVAGAIVERHALTHLHTHFSSTVALIASYVFPVTFSITIHGPAEFDDLAGFRMAEKVARASFIVTISQFGASQVMKSSDPKYWDKVHVARLGVDPAIFEPAPRREKPVPFRVICVGRLAPVKAQHVLIAAVELIVRERGPAIELTLVGDGPGRASLERTVHEKGLAGAVVFAGPCNQERVLELYRASDAFALASFAEGIPVVLMEAMAMELPCVATFVAGIPELIRDGTDGLLVPAGSAEDLARALLRLIDDVALRDRLGRSARERVMRDYDLVRNTGNLARLFAELYM